MNASGGKLIFEVDSPEQYGLIPNDQYFFDAFLGVPLYKTANTAIVNPWITAPIEVEITTTGAETLPLQIRGTSNYLTVPDETVWKINGTGLVTDEDGNAGYFNFEALIKNLEGGSVQVLNFAKVVTGGSDPVSNVSGQNTANATSTENGEAMALGKAWPDGIIQVQALIGFDFDTASVTITSSGAIFAIVATGKDGAVLSWKAKVYITPITN